MEKSELYDILSCGLLREWTDKAEKDDDCGYKQDEKNIMEELTADLSEKGKKLLTSYALAIENRINYIHYNLNIKILNFGIKIGMDLQKAFVEYE